jgi:hypothetical protein
MANEPKFDRKCAQGQTTRGYIMEALKKTVADDMDKGRT